jgi:hypothetical protein
MRYINSLRGRKKDLQTIKFFCYGWILKISIGFDNLNMRYNDSLITPMEYLDGLSFVVAKRKK